MAKAPFSLPKVSSPIIMAGAKEQHPKHDTDSNVNFPSDVVSPSLTFRKAEISFITSSAFCTWQAVPLHTFTECFPAGANLNWA